MMILLPLLAVLAIMLLGALAQRFRWLPSKTDIWLNEYVYYLAFPAILFISLAKTPIATILNGPFIAAYLLAMVLTYGLCQKLSLRYGSHSEANIRALAVTFGNTAFIGIPVLMMLYPEDPLALMATAMTSLLSVGMFAFALVKLDLARNNSPRHPLLTMARTLATNPIVLGCLAGIVVSALTVKIPSSLDTALQLIGKSSSPCALFAIGIVLAKAMRRQTGDGSRFSSATEQTLINFAKLVLQPLLALVLFSLFGVSGELRVMGTLLAAMPTAASVYLLAQRYQTLDEQSAQWIMLGTVLTLLALPLWLAVLNTFFIQ
ncbi:AEC family transporter [Shewanella cyperi]|uniref:AEC family transporter n=1 Tax=Shewanella cyperi TaxID=2814292 RepID=A0A975AMJ9_9GAMM|nr:AEC family transporter [Shewanella cyperi]QSX31906.1 AEC family transporter [Shewanella cyperi]